MNNPTIRTLAGVPATTTLNAANTALLVIDFQNEYFDGKMPIPNGMRALQNAKRLIAFADEHKMPVFHIQHITPAGSPIFAEDGQTVTFHADIQPATQHNVVQKSSVSVFASTDIAVQLKKANVQTLIIAGLMTHACVAGAARDAVPAGFDVIVADDASATRDLDTPSGDIVPHDVLHRSSLVAVTDTFGDVLTTDEILKLNIQ
ncbi:isochorismatase family protein [Iodobacter arcticus]|uniref:Isochorismatase family protein n=1 Tax=Iodobacter arcticus TaxID=590593 RepID=A0ABW2R3E3_9NEIS